MKKYRVPTSGDLTCIFMLYSVIYIYCISNESGVFFFQLSYFKYDNMMYRTEHEQIIKVSHIPNLFEIYVWQQAKSRQTHSISR
jgi:hypothetical protein